MNEEIKEILDRLERIDHKEYSCGFEFADSGSFDEDCRCFEERKKLADYITNLQEENETLRKNQRYYKNGVFSLEYDKETMSDIIDDYKSRCEKAIEWVKKNMYYFPRPDELLNILNGGDKD